MKNFARRIAVVVGAVAISAGLIGATATRRPGRLQLAAHSTSQPRLQLGPLSANHRFETRTRLSPHLSGPSA